MPNDQIYASAFNDILKKKYEARGYARMVIYIEACESGSIFDGLLSEELNIYATTAANASQSSYGSYCDGDYPHEAESPYEGICLGDMYSVSWIEDSEKHNHLEEQYKVVKRSVQYDNDYGSSQVKQFGNMAIASDSLFSYIGTNPDNDYYPSVSRSLISTPSKPSRIVSQRDTDIFYLTRMFRNAPKGSKEKLKAHNKLVDKMKHRKHVDESMKRIANLLFGSERGKGMLKAVRPAGQPLVDDWECLKSLVRTYEEKCGPLLRYEWKYNRAIANMCNAGLKAEQMGSSSDQVCGRRALRGVVNNP